MDLSIPSQGVVAGNHFWFFRAGDAFTSPEAGVASRTARPGDDDPGWIAIGPVIDAGVEKRAGEGEVWAPSTGKLALKHVVELKRELVQRFRTQEMGAFEFEMIYGSAAISALEGNYRPLIGKTKQGWLRIARYDQNDNLISTERHFVHLTVHGAVDVSDDLVRASMRARRLIAAPVVPLEPWNYAACGVVLLDGGGDTFDCYPAGFIGDDGLQQQPGFGEITLSGGTNLGEWQHGNAPYGQIFGDTFDSYAAEDPVAQTLSGGESIGAWIHGDGP